MGEIAARLQESMRSSRAEFAATFASFGQLSVQHRTDAADRRRRPGAAIAGVAR